MLNISVSSLVQRKETIFLQLAFIIIFYLKIRERINRFEKFVKENDAKRKRAILKYQQELKIGENKTKELDEVQRELAMFLLR